jgi:hypothetical protein
MPSSRRVHRLHDLENLLTASATVVCSTALLPPQLFFLVSTKRGRSFENLEGFRGGLRCIERLSYSDVGLSPSLEVYELKQEKSDFDSFLPCSHSSFEQANEGIRWIAVNSKLVERVNLDCAVFPSFLPSPLSSPVLRQQRSANPTLSPSPPRSIRRKEVPPLSLPLSTLLHHLSLLLSLY